MYACVCVHPLTFTSTAAPPQTHTDTSITRTCERVIEYKHASTYRNTCIQRDLHGERVEGREQSYLKVVCDESVVV